jgi:very-short-patch-repair endonuclease
LCNVLLRLPCGRLISPDALFLASAVIHETAGRRPHARADLFEDMQERHDVLTAAGFTVLHNSPSRLLRQPREVLSEVERCHVREDGRGLPAGVTIPASAG